MYRDVFDRPINQLISPQSHCRHKAVDRKLQANEERHIELVDAKDFWWRTDGLECVDIVDFDEPPSKECRHEQSDGV